MNIIELIKTASNCVTTNEDASNQTKPLANLTEPAMLDSANLVVVKLVPNKAEGAEVVADPLKSVLEELAKQDGPIQYQSISAVRSSDNSLLIKVVSLADRNSVVSDLNQAASKSNCTVYEIDPGVDNTVKI